MTPPLSVRLAPHLKERLQAEAKRTDLPVSHVVQKAVETYLAAAEDKRRALREAVKRADGGAFVPGDEVHAWIDSWGDEQELPAPRLVKTSGPSRS